MKNSINTGRNVAVYFSAWEAEKKIQVFTASDGSFASDMDKAAKEDGKKKEKEKWGNKRELNRVYQFLLLFSSSFVVIKFRPSILDTDWNDILAHAHNTEKKFLLPSS